MLATHQYILEGTAVPCPYKLDNLFFGVPLLYRAACKSFCHPCKAYSLDVSVFRAACKSFRHPCKAYSLDVSVFRAACKSFRHDIFGLSLPVPNITESI
jgi:hypothetical protein